MVRTTRRGSEEASDGRGCASGPATWLGPGGVQTGSASPGLGYLRGPIREALCHPLLADLAHILPYK